MALQGEWNDPKPILVMAGCKRDANDHSTVQLQKQFDAMLNDIGDTPDGRRIRSFRKERYLISPQFAGDQREKYRPTGFKCCDIRDLARELGVDPGPEPEAEPVNLMPSPQPQPRHRRTRQDEEPSLDM